MNDIEKSKSKRVVLVNNNPPSGMTEMLVQTLNRNGFDARYGTVEEELEPLPHKPSRKSQRTDEEVNELMAAAEAKRIRKANKRKTNK